MGHGTHDPVVRLAWAESSRKTLAGAGFDVDWHVYPMEHSATMEEIAAVGAFLRRVLG
jgi:phospholipase/carboxylesterase